MKWLFQSWADNVPEIEVNIHEQRPQEVEFSFPTRKAADELREFQEVNKDLKGASLRCVDDKGELWEHWDYTGIHLTSYLSSKRSPDVTDIICVMQFNYTELAAYRSPQLS